MKKFALFSVVALGLFVFSCQEKENGPVSQIRIDNISSISQSKISVLVNIVGPTTSILEKGIFWDTVPNPKIKKNKKVNTEAGNQFTDTAEGLRHSTRYYVQAYLAVGKDTIYSNVATATTNTIITLMDKEYPFDQNAPAIVDVVGNEQEGFTICFSMARAGLTVGSFLRLMKVNSSGDVIWKRDYDDGTSKEPRIIRKLPDGYLVGSTSWASGSASLILRKFDTNGNPVWERELNKDAFQFPIRISVRKDAFLITMRTFNLAVIDDPRRVVSLWDFTIDINGNIIAEKGYSNFTSLEGININYNPIETNDLGFFYYSSFGYTQDNIDVMNFSFDAQNSRKWKKIYETPLSEQPIKATIGVNGNFVVVGYQWNQPNWSTRRFVYEFSQANGELVWEKFYDDFSLSRYAEATEIVAFNGMYYLGGAVSSGNSVNAKMVVSRLDASGNIDWEYSIGPIKGNNGAHIGKIYVAAPSAIYVFGTRGYVGPIFSTSPSVFCMVKIQS